MNPANLVPGGYYSSRLPDDEKQFLEELRKLNSDLFVEEYCRRHSLEHLLRPDTEEIKAHYDAIKTVTAEVFAVPPMDMYSGEKCGPKGAVHDYAQVPGDKCDCYEPQYAPNIGCGLLDDVMYPEDQFGRYVLPTPYLRWLSIKLFFADLFDFIPHCLEKLWR